MAGAQDRANPICRGIGDRGCSRQLLDLVLALGQPHAPDLGADVDELAYAGARSDHLGRVEAQVLLFDADLDQSVEGAADEPIWILAVPPCDHVRV